MKMMTTPIPVLALAVCAAAAEKGFEGRPPLHNVSMPTGFTLNEGEFVVGLGPLGFGFTGRFQASTNVLLFLFQDMNADFRCQVLRSEALNAAAVLFGWERFQLKLGVSVFRLLDLPTLAVPVIGLWWRFRV